MSEFVRRSPSSQAWLPSPSGAPGCFSKRLFEYGPEALGRDGAAGSYTTYYRFDPGARYPSWRILEGTVEIGVLRGTLEINGDALSAGEWAQLRGREEGWLLGSIDGCEILAVVRGRIESVRPA